MTGIRLNASCAALVIGLAVAGCGDSGTAPADGLKPSEAEALYDALGRLALLGFGEPGSPVPATGTSTHECRQGGEVVVSIDIDVADQRFGADVEPMACGVSSGGWEFKLQGNPDYTLVLDFTTEDFMEYQIVEFDA